MCCIIGICGAKMVKLKWVMSDTALLPLSVSEFVALLNQTLEYAYPDVVVTGELMNFRVSKNRWVYFDLKDDEASVKCFGTVYQLPGPLEDGMLLQVRAQPRLHKLYGFSLNIMSLRPAGEGTIRRAAELLQAKLAAEGLFAPERKRLLPYPPRRIGLVTSSESAAYADFVKILNARWVGVEVQLVDVQVQGDAAPAQLVAALEVLNELAEPPEAIVMIRGGGSAEDLAAFSHEQVTRAVAGSRVPTLVAIGHEVDISLAELAADLRASTPSNAAELLVPDKRDVLVALTEERQQLNRDMQDMLKAARERLARSLESLSQLVGQRLRETRSVLATRRQLLEALSPQMILKRGYAVIRKNGLVMRQVKDLRAGDTIEIQLGDGRTQAKVG